MCTVPEKRHARLEPSMWNQLSGWSRLSGVKRAAVPLWHINLYGQLTLQCRSQAPPSSPPLPTERRLRLSGIPPLCTFCFSVHEIMTQKSFPLGFSLDKRRDWKRFKICSTLFFVFYSVGSLSACSFKLCN